MRDKIRAVVVAGARPNFVKCAPLLSALDETKLFKTFFVHTGQHYDYEMSEIFFKHLRLKKPDIFLNVGSAPRLKQIASVGRRFEKALKKIQPNIVIVVGDVNSTLGAAMAAKKMGLKLAHIEAGLRSFDKSMPEELNRIKTDALSDILFTTSISAGINLAREGIARENIYFVGNIMIDTLMSNLKSAEESKILSTLGLSKKEYYLLTLHRPANVDNLKTLKGIFEVIGRIGSHSKVVFPVHPRTEKMFKRFKVFEKIKNDSPFMLVKPLGYLDFLKLMRYSRMVFTDSGGIQEESAYLKVPCLTLRANTERPVTVEAGANIIAGTNPDTILSSFNKIRSQFNAKKVKSIKFWDGKAAYRIAQVLLNETKR